MLAVSVLGLFDNAVLTAQLLKIGIGVLSFGMRPLLAMVTVPAVSQMQ